MHSVYLWGWSKSYLRDVYIQLEKEKIIDIKRWFIAEGMDEDSFFKNKNYIECPWRFDIYKGWGGKYSYPPYEIDKIIEDNMMTIMHNSTRLTDIFSIPMHEVINMINQLKNHYYFIMNRDKPDWIIFYNLPHYPEGMVLYFTAKAMGIKTLLFAMTSFEDEQNYLLDLNDYGSFVGVPEYKPLHKDRREEDIEDPSRIAIPYMAKEIIQQERELKKDFRQKIRGVINPYGFLKERMSICKETKEKYDFIEEFISMRLHKWTNKRFNEIIYRKRLREAISKDLSMDESYVYFPLHQQPEMSTDTQSGCFTDQLLAIEKISRLLPKGWKIFVKENPKQRSYKRGSFFFKRLLEIPDVVLVDRDIDTHELIQHAMVVATINGTAAWEAICVNKPAIIFGKYWYNGLPGIFSYSDNIDIEAVANYTVDRNELKRAVFEKKKKMLPIQFEGKLTKIVGKQSAYREEFYSFLKYMLK